MRLIAALNHEVRRTLLRLLAASEEALSPASMVRSTGIPLSTVGYHLDILRECRAVEEIRSQAAHGRVEHLYRSLIEEDEVATALLGATRYEDEAKELS